MFCKNDYVNYRTQGVCKIEEIRFIQFDPACPGHRYYILKPILPHSADIFVPVDNPRLTQCIRPILSAQEVDNIILSIKDQKLSWEKDRKRRTTAFKNILLKHDERELLLLIDCLYVKWKEDAKGVSSTDLQFLKTAENMIEQEFSFSLQMAAKDVGPYIRNKLGLNESA